MHMHRSNDKKRRACSKRRRSFNGSNSAVPSPDATARRPLPQCNQSKHAAGFSLFGAIGIVTIQIAGRAYAGVVNLFYPEGATLPDDFRRKIDLVMRRANTGTELHD